MVQAARWNTNYSFHALGAGAPKRELHVGQIMKTLSILLCCLVIIAESACQTHCPGCADHQVLDDNYIEGPSIGDCIWNLEHGEWTNGMRYADIVCRLGSECISERPLSPALFGGCVRFLPRDSHMASPVMSLIVSAGSNMSVNGFAFTRHERYAAYVHTWELEDAGREAVKLSLVAVDSRLEYVFRLIQTGIIAQRQSIKVVDSIIGAPRIRHEIGDSEVDVYSYSVAQGRSGETRERLGWRLAVTCGTGGEMIEAVYLATNEESIVNVIKLMRAWRARMLR